MKHSKTDREQMGYSLIAAMIFVLLIVISGMAFFTMAAQESSGALYRQETTEAFYLADAAIERARAKFLEDRAWRDGWTDEDCGSGSYSLTVADTAYGGMNDCVQLVSTGVSGRAVRQVEVIAEVPPTSLGLAVHINGDADVNGGICVTGNVHVVGDGDFGPNDVMLACGEVSEGFSITPPPIYTDPAHFPGATYYYVKGTQIGGDYQARIFDAAGNDITTALGDSLTSVTTYNGGHKEFTFNFDSDALLTQYFDTTSGVFSRHPGDIAVVVNFGEIPLMNPPGPNGASNVRIDGGGTVLKTTIINTRFTGASIDQRQDPDYWHGGLTAPKQVTMEPDYGIAILAADFAQVGTANVYLGTTTTPAYVYVTKNVTGINANVEIYGAITVLGDWTSTGFLDIDFDLGFLDDIPSYLVDTYPAGVSGTLRVLTWKEM